VTTVTQLVDRGGVKLQNERIRVEFMNADLDLAFALLRLAETELSIGNAPRATELIEKAVLARRTVMRQVSDLSMEFYDERGELHERTQRLMEAIITTVRRVEVFAG
jgi:hypothetical protein